MSVSTPSKDVSFKEQADSARDVRPYCSLLKVSGSPTYEKKETVLYCNSLSLNICSLVGQCNTFTS
jgi:hypothetical protein